MTSTHIELRRMPVAALTPAPYNPRREIAATSPAYRKLAASLREFGLVEPLIWNELTGHVVGGHLRLRILRELGVAEVPVSVVRLTPEREKALNIILNNREAQGRYDPTKLAEILKELSDLPEMPLTGFDASDLAALQFAPLGELPEMPEPEEMEVTILARRDTYERLAPKLDALVREFDLVCHVKEF